MKASESNHFRSARIKLEWAAHLIQQVEIAWKDMVSKSEFTLRVNRSLLHKQIVSFDFDEISPVVPILYGDAFHSIRSSLDYVITEILSFDNKWLYFPINENSQQLAATFTTGGNTLLEKVVPGIGDFFVNNVRSYRRSDGWLWVLNKLNNVNKHRIIMPCSMPHRINGLHLSMDDGDHMDFYFNNLTLSGFEGRNFNMLGLPPGRIVVKEFGSVEAELWINEPAIIEPQNAIDVLHKCYSDASKAIDGIECFLEESGFFNKEVTALR